LIIRGGGGRGRPAAIVNKKDVLAQIITVLKLELAALTKAAHESFSAATDPDSKAENKYDTRSLEASYVARGQAQRVADLQEAVRAFESMPSTPFPEGSTITLGSLIGLEGPDGHFHYLLGPAAGGTEITVNSIEVTVITPGSPLGQKLIGERVGSSIAINPSVSVRVESIE
jgi:transcription elongation GreA/GreB family factor